jgi:hypothetical protein
MAETKEQIAAEVQKRAKDLKIYPVRFYETRDYFMEQAPVVAEAYLDALSALKYIASHDNVCLTDGSGATRICIDALVDRARAALAEGKQ